MKIKNLYFSPVKSLSFNNVDNLEIIKNIGIKNDRIFAFTYNLNLKDIELIKNNPLKREIYKFLSLKKYQTDCVCRTRMLLDYFGERMDFGCGLCDFCLSKIKSNETVKSF